MADELTGLIKKVYTNIENDEALQGNTIDNPFRTQILPFFVDNFDFILYNRDPRYSGPVMKLCAIHLYPATLNPTDTNQDIKIDKYDNSLFETVMNDGKSKEEMYPILYDAVKRAVVIGLQHHGKIQITGSELHWHAISRLANIIEQSIDSNSLHQRNCSI